MPAEGGAMNTRLQRPRTTPVSNRLTARQAAGRSEEVRPGTASSDGQDIELLEYEWPDLPPLPSVKDAITRSRVSHGISYLLPVDKGLNSINSRYRTDLRAMFQEPYASEHVQYDDSQVTHSSKVHFQSNTCDNRWTRQHLHALPVNLNADCEDTRRLYARSAPSGGRASRLMGIDPHKLRTRSSLYLPLKAAVPPEFVKLRQEVQDIIKSVREDDGDFDEQQILEDNAQVEEVHGDVLGTDTDSDRVGVVKKKASVMSSPRFMALATRRQSAAVPSDRYSSYEELKGRKAPKPQIPAKLKSQYLSDFQNQQIWDWLHYGEQMSDFEYFLSVCG